MLFGGTLIGRAQMTPATGCGAGLFLFLLQFLMAALTLVMIGRLQAHDFDRFLQWVAGIA